MLGQPPTKSAHNFALIVLNLQPHESIFGGLFLIPFAGEVEGHWKWRGGGKRVRNNYPRPVIAQRCRDHPFLGRMGIESKGERNACYEIFIVWIVVGDAGVCK